MVLRKIANKIDILIGKNKNRKLVTDWRNRLENDKFSIICSNCIGGIIYERLGKQFLSPTINMYFTQRDFIKFAVNLKYYIGQDLRFIKTDKPYPVAMLDDITLYFNHSNTEEEAANDWNRRKKRINYDNLYIIFYYRNGYTTEELRQIEKANYKNVILLTNKPLDIEYSFYIEEESGKLNSDSFLDKDRYNIRTFEKKWDFVEWLNNEIKRTYIGM